MDIEINRSSQENNVAQENKRKNPKKILKIMALVLVLAILIGGGVFGYRKFQEKRNLAKQTQEEPTDLIGQYKQDLSELKKKAESGNPEDLQAYGIAQYATGDQAGAIDTYKKQIEKDPKSVVANSGLANALRDQKNYDEAIAQYKKVIEISPTDISAYVNLASVYQYQLNQKDKALEIYQQGIEKNPKSADLLALKGLAYEQMENIDEAKKAYEKALEIDGENKAAKIALDRLNQ